MDRKVHNSTEYQEYQVFSVCVCLFAFKLINTALSFSSGILQSNPSYLVLTVYSEQRELQSYCTGEVVK